MRTLTTVCFLLFSVVTAWAQPNFVVIMTDDQDDTGSMNYMPKVHSVLAEHGITFTNSFVNFSLCCPSRASFLTGQAAHNHGVKTNSWRKGGGWPAFRDKEGNSLPVWLKAAGYQTAFIGKYLNGYRAVEPPKEIEARKRAIANKYRLNAVPPAPSPLGPPGWDLWFVFALGPRYYNYRITENGKILQFGASDYSADIFRDRAVQFIKDQKASEPFFLFIPLHSPHRGGFNDDRARAAPRHANLFTDAQLPNLPAVNEEDVSDKPSWVQKRKALDAADKRFFQAVYHTRLQALQAVDDLVEAVVNALRSTGELDDTFIIFTSDNGFLYGEHRLRGKIHVYEGSIRVPLVIRGPGVPEDQTRSQLVNNLDVVATIEQLAGVTPGLVPDGRSLVPLFTDANAPWRSAILVEGGHDLARASKRFVGVRTGTKKYVKYDDGFEELYDLSADPYELENKAGDASYASDLASLRATHDRLKDCAGETCWVP